MRKHFVVPMGLLLTVMPALSQENYQLWQSYSTIKVNTQSSGANVASTQVNFPVLVRLGGADSAAFSSAETGGADVRFAKLNGTHLSYHIEQWDSVDRAAALWVLLDTVYGNDTTLFKMYWGNKAASDSSNPGMVFDTSNGFAGVYHLSNLNDATPNAANGSTAGTADTVGIIGHCRQFNGVAGDSVMISGLMGSPGAVTLSCWVMPNYAPPVSIGLAGGDAVSIGDNVAMRIDSEYAMDPFYYAAGSSAWLFDTTLNVPGVMGGSWTYMTYVCDPTNSNEQAYVNGALSATETYSGAITYSQGSNTYLGHHGNGNNAYNYGGLIDEVRIEKVTRSADWIKLCFATQQIGQTAVTHGPILPVSVVLFTPNARALASFKVTVTGSGVLFSIPTGVTHAGISMVDIEGRTVMHIAAASDAREVGWKGTLPAGTYIVHLSGINAKTGEAMAVERKVAIAQ